MNTFEKYYTVEWLGKFHFQKLKIQRLTDLCFILTLNTLQNKELETSIDYKTLQVDTVETCIGLGPQLKLK